MRILHNHYLKHLLMPAVVFIILLPASLLVNFYQNDDWCYYMTVERFMSGNFTLHPYVGPTFYLQGFMGMLFAKLFGIVHLPTLTLLVACGALYFFVLTLNEFLKVDFKWSLVLGLMLFFNPLGVYELWGYMTNHYFGLFLLAALYFFLKYENTLNQKYNIAYLILVFLGLLVRQTSMVLPVAVSLFYLLQKKFKNGVLHFGYFIALYVFYSKILPLTPRILEVPLQLENFLKQDYMYAVVYGSFIVLAAYLIPLVVNAVDFNYIFSKRVVTIAFVLLFMAAFFGLNKLYKPMEVSWGEFPYFENTVERTGFYPRGVHGTKYYFAGNFEMWKDWDLAAKVLLASLLAYLVINFRKKLNIFSLYIIVYFGLVITTKTYYDRYIYTVAPITAFYLLSIGGGLKSYTKFILVGFVAFLIFIAYLFSADFILVNHYIWNKSLSLVNAQKIDPASVSGTNAWKLSYRGASGEYSYLFSYDSQRINQDFREQYTLLETHKIDFPLNIFINPNVYLYERIQR